MNLNFRKRLGLPEDQHILGKSIRVKRTQEKQHIKHLQRSMKQLQDENVSLKLHIKKDLEVEKSTEKNGMYYEMYKETIEENEFLRKGLHDILNSVQNSKRKIGLVNMMT